MSPELDLRGLIDKIKREIMEQREEILRAFVAKYGFDPDQVEQVVDFSDLTKIRWYLRKKGGDKDVRSGI